MNNALLKLYIKMQNLMMQEDGQDLVEYALVLSLITVGAIAMLSSIGSKVATIFTAINTGI